MEAKVSELLENILGLLALEGSFETEETDEAVLVSIETQDPGRLIGVQGQTLASLQLLINQMLSRQLSSDKKDEGQPKRVVIDVANWRKSKEEELAHQARSWANEVIETKQTMDLQPMPSWQRRIVHMTLQETPGVKSESAGEGLDRHIVITPED